MKLKYRFVTQKVGNQVAAVPIDADPEQFNGLVKLNDTGATVFAMLGADVTEEEILAKLADEYDRPEEELREDMRAFLAALRESGLLEE